MSPHCKKHENKKVDGKSVEFVCFALNVTKIPHKIKTLLFGLLRKGLQNRHT